MTVAALEHSVHVYAMERVWVQLECKLDSVKERQEVHFKATSFSTFSSNVKTIRSNNEMVCAAIMVFFTTHTFLLVGVWGFTTHTFLLVGCVGLSSIS